MRNALRDNVLHAWIALVAITVASWLTARDGGAAHEINAVVTVVVLLIAAAKAQLVIWRFMEVDRAPPWTRVTTSAWVVGLFGILLALYFVTV